MSDTAVNPVDEVGYASVTEHLAALHAYRIDHMDPGDLQINIDQRQQLEDTADRAGFVAVGDRVEPFTLQEVHGTTLTLDGLLADGPVVLVFFRFAGCPACNIALPHYQRELHQGVSELGATLVAVSPQVPDGLVEIKDRHELEFAVASDQGNTLARRFGVTYVANEASQAYAAAQGADLGEIVGTGEWELPMPTVVVIDTDAVVRFADVHPDWLVRTEAADVLAVLRTITTPSA